MSYYRKMIGERLYLSPISENENDGEKYLAWMNDKAVTIYFSQYHSAVASKSDLSWLYEPPADMQRYAMVLLEGDELLGSISIHNIDHLNRNAFIGIFIGDAERRGKGFGAEAIRLILCYGFYTLNLHSILLTVLADNPGGIACYKKVGFREVGRLPEHIYHDGTYVDKLYMGILKHEFGGERT
jgi:RimJ/RimL family protein N-acetyltransferase